MKAAAQSQRTNNSSFCADPTIAPLGEALWRLRLAPSAVDLHAVLPQEAFISPVLVDVACLAEGIDVDLHDIHAVLMLPPGPAEVVQARPHPSG